MNTRETRASEHVSYGETKRVTLPVAGKTIDFIGDGYLEQEIRDRFQHIGVKGAITSLFDSRIKRFFETQDPTTLGEEWKLAEQNWSVYHFEHRTQHRDHLAIRFPSKGIPFHIAELYVNIDGLSQKIGAHYSDTYEVELPSIRERLNYILPLTTKEQEDELAFFSSGENGKQRAIEAHTAEEKRERELWGPK